MVKINIIKRRVELGLTQQQVADQVGINRSSYTAIERGLREAGRETAQRIALVLNININDAFPITEKTE